MIAARQSTKFFEKQCSSMLSQLKLVIPSGGKNLFVPLTPRERSFAALRMTAKVYGVTAYILQGMLTYQASVRQGIKRQSEGGKNILLDFSRWIEQAAAVQPVSGNSEFSLIQQPQDFLKSEVLLCHIALQEILHSGANNQGKNGDKSLALCHFIAMNVQTAHIQIVFQIVKTLFSLITAAVDFQNLRRRFSEVCFGNKEKAAL